MTTGCQRPEKICSPRRFGRRGRRGRRRLRTEESSRGLLEAAPDAMVIVDGEGRIRFVNTQLEKMFGYRREKLHGQIIETLIPERFRERHAAHRAAYILDPKVRPMGGELKLFGLRRDGSEFPVDISLSPLRTAQGVMAVAAIRDLSERSKSEQQQAVQYVVARVLAGSATLVEAAPRLLQAVCETLGWAMGEIWSVDRSAGLLRQAESWHVPDLDAAEFVAASRGITFTPGEGLPGRVWQSGRPAWVGDVTADLTFPRAALAARTGLHGAFAFPIVLETQILGVMIFLCRKVRPVDTELLKVFSGIGSQIGQFMERKRAEEALRFSEARYRALHRDNPTTIFTLDAEGTVLSVNPFGASDLGYAREELEGEPVLKVFHEEDRPAVAEQLQRCLRNPNQVYRWQLRKIRKDGGVGWVEELAQAVYDLNGALNVLVVCQDITERKKAQEELERRVLERTRELSEANAKLKELDRLKSMFIASMSHELRTPLNSVIGFSSILLDEWVGPLSADQKEDLNIVLRSGKHLLALIDDVIDVSKIEAGMIEPHIEEFDIADVVAEAAGTFARGSEGRGFALEVEPIRQIVRTDRRRLLQCLLNLLSNAVKFTEKGTITVTARRFAPAEGGRIEVSVADTGIGIREEDLPRLFSPFVRLESPLKSKVTGTGLGLYLTKKLVTEVLKGEISVASRYGEGSTFSIKIPAAE